MTNQFLPLWVCKKLAEIGCISNSCHLYLSNDRLSTVVAEGTLADNYFSLNELQNDVQKFQAFTPYDFIGTSEQVRKNSEILWGDVLGKSAYVERHACIDSDDAVVYICGFLEEK